MILWSGALARVRRRAAELGDRLEDALGGPARARVIVLLACVLGLDSADQGTLGAVAGQLKNALDISNTEVGLLATVVSVVGLVATLPVGVLTDRMNRTRLLAGSIVLWAVAMVAAGAATSYLALLFARLFLGAVIATAGPTVASLTGDFFPAGERGRIYGFILAGELLGTGFGFVLAGDIAAATSWRWAFWVLAVPALVLAAVIWRLPEPARGGQSRLGRGARHVTGVAEVRRGGAASGEPGAGDEEREREQEDVATQVVRRAHVPPSPELVLHADPARMPLWRAVRYVLRVRTNLVLILASSLGYFFFAGLRTFAVVFMGERYGLGQAAASTLLVGIGLAAVVGVLVGGRVGDRLILAGRINGRIIVAAVSFLAAVVFFLPGVLSTSLAISVPLYMLGTAALGAPNPPMDAARLDIIHHHLWGRAEGVRTVLRLGATAAAPLLFGYASTQIGLAYTFALMLAPLAVSGVILLDALRMYARDVATAAASEDATRSGSRPHASA